MRIKKYFGLLTAICFSLCLAGCGEAFPELTEDEYNQTVEFAVGLLMKYSNNGQAKLTYVDAKEVSKQREKEAALADKDKEKEKEKETTTPASTPTPEPVKEPESTSPDNDDTSSYSTEDSTLDASVDTQGDDSTNESSVDDQETEPVTDNDEPAANTDDPNAVVISTEETQEIIDGIFLAYEGYSISSTYPESSKSYVINADKGKKLLVLRFDLYNGSNSAKKVNILEKNIKFQVILNGKNLGYTPVTFLPNDLSSYVGTIDSRAHESLVVLTEIDQSMAKEIQSLGMIVSIDGVDQKVSLK